MKEHKFRDYICWGVTALLVIVTCIGAALIFIRWQSVCEIFRYLGRILAPVTYGAVLAYLLAPVYNRTGKIGRAHV